MKQHPFRGAAISVVLAIPIIALYPGDAPWWFGALVGGLVNIALQIGEALGLRDIRSEARAFVRERRT
jgi:hypothetical protein